MLERSDFPIVISHLSGNYEENLALKPWDAKVGMRRMDGGMGEEIAVHVPMIWEDINSCLIKQIPCDEIVWFFTRIGRVIGANGFLYMWSKRLRDLLLQ